MDMNNIDEFEPSDSEKDENLSGEQFDQTAKSSWKKKLLIRGFLALLGLGILGGLGVAGVFVYVSMSLPKLSGLDDYNPPIVTEIYSNDGSLLFEGYKEKRVLAKMEEIPEIIVDSFLSAEDDKFFEHAGVDYQGVLRAMFANLKAGRVVQGGSTITQQVAKSLLLTRERSLIRKIKDFLLAQKIEKKFSKKEILYLYLNQVYLGGGFYGVKAAFKGYFGKDLNEATVAESALIAGLLVAPGKYNPYVRPKQAKKRQNYVLKRLYDNKKISEDMYKRALKEDVRLRIREKPVLNAGYYTDWIRQRVMEVVGADRFYTDGFRIKTTLDWNLQQSAEKAVVEGLKKIDRRQGFKGPINKIVLENELQDLERKTRQEILKERSHYLIFSPDGTVKDEFVYNEKDYEQVHKYQSMLLQDYGSNKMYRPGVYPEDGLLHLLEKGKSYKAVVLKTINSAKVVFVSIGGVIGIIDHDGFKWAHERVLTEERKYFSPVNRPASILKPGDVVMVNVKSEGAVSGWSAFDKKFKSKYESKDIERLYKNQKYVLLDLDQKVEVQGALISIEPRTGKILALVGGSDFEQTKFNRAIQAKRQPGSSVKPFIYALGLENGFTPASTLIDSPSALSGVGDGLKWKPRNYDGKFKGAMTFRQALETSRNVPTIKLAETLGIRKLNEFNHRTGFYDEEVMDLGFSLGNFGVTLADMAKAYAIFPNGGKRIDLKSIVSVIDRYGQEYDINLFSESKSGSEEKGDEKEADSSTSPVPTPVATPEAEINQFLTSLSGNQVYDARLAHIMVNLLRGVVQFGTGRGAKSVSKFIGGKTGTTNSYVDAWFMGFSSNLVTGVWTGMDDNTTMGFGETGGRSALPIWAGYMKSALRIKGEYDFSVPLGIVNVNIDRDSGALASANALGSYLESFVEGTEPGVEKTFDPIVENEKGETTIDKSGSLYDDDYYNNVE